MACSSLTRPTMTPLRFLLEIGVLRAEKLKTSADEVCFVFDKRGETVCTK